MMKSKILIFLLAGLTFFVPILPMMYVIIGITTLDLITAIIKDLKLKKEKGLKKIKHIKSRKLRRTVIKTILYLLFTSMVYAIFQVCFGAGLFFVKLSTFAISFTELYSVAENIGVITGDNILIRIVRNIFKKPSDFIGKIMEKPNED